MELFDTHFVYFAQVLLVSGLKSYKLPILQVVKLQPYLDYFTPKCVKVLATQCLKCRSKDKYMCQLLKLSLPEIVGHGR